MSLFSKQSFTRDGAKQNLKKFASSAKETLKKRWWVMLIELAALALLLVADLVSKQYVVPFLLAKPGHTYKLIPGFIHLTYSENTGAGFGMLSGNTTLLIVVTFIVVIGLVIFLILAQKQNEWLRASLLLIVGGGIGNLVDRVGLGYVRDFIDYAFLKNFAICNVADVFVTVGAVMLIIVLIVMLVQEGRKNQKEFEKEQAGKSPEQVSDPLEAPMPLNPMMSSPNEYTFEVTKQEADAAPEDTAEQPQNGVDGEDPSQTEHAPEPDSAQDTASRDKSAESDATGANIDGVKTNGADNDGAEGK